MKMIGGFIGILMIVFALTFIGSGNVGATNCYNLYYNQTCGNYDWENWDSVKLALHRDKTWEAVGPVGFGFNGNWNVFGNAIYLYIGFAIGDGSIPACFETRPFLAGTKTGVAKLFDDPYKSKANISKAQGFIKNEGIAGPGCWYLKKVKNNQCPWISEK